jgi:putative ABC transport system permease protein
VPQLLRFAFRRLRRSPGFSIAAVLCLGLGIGANTALFNVVNAVLLRPLPFAQPDRLVGVWESNAYRGSERNSVSPANYLDWRKENTVFEQLAAVWDYSAGLSGSGEPEEVPVQRVTANFFSALGLGAARGRTFLASEDVPNGPRVAVLSDELWRRRYGGSPSIVGEPIQVDDRPFTVIGIMPPAIPSLTRAPRPALWVPLGLDPSHDYHVGSGRYLRAVARLKPGISAGRAQAELATIAARLAEAYPRFNSHWTVSLVPITEQVVGDVRRPLAVLSGVVLVVLLIACANVANLQLAQATARRRENAVHAALGASGWDLGRQILLESLLMSVGGGLLGLLLAWWGTDALSALAASNLPRMEEVALDLRALGFALAISLGSALVFGLVSAVSAAKADLNADLREGSRGTSGRGQRTRAVLVAGQVALSLVLLAGAGLLLKSFARLQSVDLGFNPDRVLTARISLSEAHYPDPERQVRFFQDLLRGVASIPGVQSVGAINWLPLSGQRSATRIIIDGEPTALPGEEPGADIRAVDPNYFQTLQIPVVRGRPIAATDTREAPGAVVVSRSFVEQYLSGDPIGRRIRMAWGDTLVATVVGVVGDVKHTGVDSVTSPTVYWSLPQFPQNFMTLVMRATGDPERLVTGVTDQVRALDPNQPLADVKTFDEWLGGTLGRRRFSLLLLGGFAGLALVLTVVGLYGTTSYGVVQRTREFGIRVALGASSSMVLRGVLRTALAVVLAGIVAGIAGATLLTGLLSTLLYDVSATDPLVFVGMAFVLLIVGAAASYLPARRATRVDPMVALRSE